MTRSKRLAFDPPFSVADISWGEDAGWGKIGWRTPKQLNPTPNPK